MVSCFTKGIGGCNPDELDKAYQNLSDASFNQKVEIATAGLFILGALHDIKNVSHYAKMKFIHSKLLRSMKNPHQHSSCQRDSKEGLGKLFGFEFTDGLLA